MACYHRVTLESAEPCVMWRTLSAVPCPRWCVHMQLRASAGKSRGTAGKSAHATSFQQFLVRQDERPVGGPAAVLAGAGILSPDEHPDTLGQLLSAQYPLNRGARKEARHGSSRGIGCQKYSDPRTSSVIRGGGGFCVPASATVPTSSAALPCWWRSITMNQFSGRRV